MKTAKLYYVYDARKNKQIWVSAEVNGVRKFSLRCSEKTPGTWNTHKGGLYAKMSIEQITAELSKKYGKPVKLVEAGVIGYVSL